jgi:tRNA threonylcarbamoyladenosine biosynthesis protein TsaB
VTGGAAVLGLDTATPATVVGVAVPGAETVERRHDPAPGARPEHAARLLALAQEALDAAGVGWPDVRRIGAGVGPGSFTGLRIGVATARALAQASGAELVAVSTLEALALGALAGAALDPPAVAAGEPVGGAGVLAVLDARRGEAFAAAWLDGDRVLAPVALGPEALARTARDLAHRGASRWLAVGNGALRFRAQIEPAAVPVPADGSPLHRVSASEVCRLAATGPAVAIDALIPEYVRVPDADLARRPAGRA